MADGAAGLPVSLVDATLGYDGRPIWEHLSLDIEPNAFYTILGPNGSGKTSLLRAILGLTPLVGGSIEVLGSAPRRGNPAIGYIPQHQTFERDLTMRGRDLVQLGLDGNRWGLGRLSSEERRQVERAIDGVGATPYAGAPIGRLSGGEQQRLRIAQALVGDPRMLLCDEPLASLDLRYQGEITGLIGDWQRRSGGTVIFVTHDINPVLDLTKRVLFVVNGRWAAGTPDEVLTSAKLTELYGSPVDVLRVRGRVVVVGEATDTGLDIGHSHSLPHPLETGVHA
ncbi:MAG: metal ABC transporter ATP-binding protein [Candidatus Limnocylindrales bacterium]